LDACNLIIFTIPHFARYKFVLEHIGGGLRNSRSFYNDLSVVYSKHILYQNSLVGVQVFGFIKKNDLNLSNQDETVMKQLK
jgi:hypothetical protein